MIEIIRRLLNYNSLHSMTERLLDYRKRALSSKGVLRVLYIHKYYRLCRSFASDIPLETIIGDGLVLPHGANGIFVSRGAIIGNDCTIFQQVTIGSNTLKSSKGYGTPQIGNKVYIGAGAKIIGNVKIGDNVRIGSNAVISKSIPSNATVVMEAPRVITHEDKQDNTFEAYKS